MICRWLGAVACVRRALRVLGLASATTTVGIPSRENVADGRRSAGGAGMQVIP